MDNGKARPRILLISRNLPPLTGGMERLIFETARGLREWSELTVIGPRGCRGYFHPDTDVYEVPSSLFGFIFCAFYRAIMLSLARNFALALGGSGLVAPVLWALKTIARTKTAIFVHGLDVVVNNAAYQRVFIPALRGVDTVIANSQNTRELAINRLVNPGRITVVNPGTDIPDITALDSRASFCLRHAIEFRKIILFTGRITQRKGLSAFISKSLPAILDAQPTAGLVVVGDDPSMGLAAHGEKKRALEIAEQYKLTPYIRFLGQVSDPELLAAYAAADVQILPLVEIAGDVEGFGMVAIEAASCGTPTIAFNVGGVSDAISEHNGALVYAGDYERMAATVLDFINMSPVTSKSCIEHAERFAWPVYNRKIRDTLFPGHFSTARTEH